MPMQNSNISLTTFWEQFSKRVLWKFNKEFWRFQLLWKKNLYAFESIEKYWMHWIFVIIWKYLLTFRKYFRDLSKNQMVQKIVNHSNFYFKILLYHFHNFLFAIGIPIFLQEIFIIFKNFLILSQFNFCILFKNLISLFLDYGKSLSYI